MIEMNHSFKKGVICLNQRMKAISDAAARLFLRQGYARTQISHIAKAAGVSVGTIYLDFAGKREILSYLLKCALDPHFAEQELNRPVTEALFAGLEEEIAAHFERSGRAFASHLRDGGYGFEDLLSDAFDLLARYAVGCLFIEKNQFDFQELARPYVAYRKQFFDTMTAYIRALIGRGVLRPLEHLELSTALIVETLSWWAMDVRYTAFETKDIPPELAKQVCLDNLVAAYKR